MNNDLGIDINEGVSQSERQLSALVPGYVKIEEREIPDFLMFISALSEQFNYYNDNNHADGDWETFFRSDAHVLVALISRTDFSKQLSAYEQQLSQIAASENDRELTDRLKALFEFIRGTATRFDKIREQFRQSGNYGDVTGISEILDNIGSALPILKIYNREAFEHFGDEVKVDFEDTFISEYIDNPPAGKIFPEGKDVRTKVLSALPHLTDLFSSLREKYNHLSATAEYFLEKHQLLQAQYPPHLSLLMTFLGLYRHLKDKINDIPARHLDFYFREVLGVQGKMAEPDRVHLILEKEEGPSAVLVKTSDTLEASGGSDDHPIRYRLLVDILVTKARVADLKTLFVSDYLLLPARSHSDSDIREAQVYSGSHPVFNPAAYLKNPRETKSWPIQGEDQHDISGNQRTMDDTDLGLIIGSPLLYQTEGERSFSLTLHFDRNSTEAFKAYVENFRRVADKKETSTVLHELLSAAFIIHYTAGEGWREILNYKTDFIELGAITIIFSLSASEGPLHIYDPLIHGGSYQSGTPFVRLLLNNYSSHSPYSFFRSVILSRVSIDVKVKGHLGLKLQNNIGALSPANPFQPFGPQPTVGSFLNIKNTNIFNRYTQDFCFHIEWLDLPKNKHGFDEYYSAYNARITNSSFIVGISSLFHGKFRPDPANQQIFRLFETTSDNYLKDHTDIQQVDFKKIEFLNEPQLLKEDESIEANFKEGVVKLELLGPPDTFGHRLFPQIFPDIVMHNAKTFVKKRPLPNQPYIPVMKSISVDYHLSHTETLTGDTENSSGSELILIHQYPFGYEPIYPQNDRKTYYFMPQFSHASNLYVGMKDLQPEQELSLLFELEEKKFHHTIHEPELIRWSYLAGNNWIFLPEKDVLYDTTNNFINSGVVKLKMPPEIHLGNSVLSPGLFWLRASVPESTGISSRVIAVHTNAVTAERILGHPSQSFSEFNLAPGSIRNFTKNIKGIQNIWQLFPSFGGWPKESRENYYIRVSERLRHKQRPVQIIDIIQVILEKFPEILIAKCFSNSAQEYLVLPGVNLQVIVIPKEKEDGRFISEEPKVSLSTLYKVKKFLTKVVSPFLNIEVGNPAYEKVKVACKVVFAATDISDNGFFLRKLNEDINAYIAPWLFGRTEDLKIGSRIYKSDILNFIKTRPYVVYTTGFSVIHFYKQRDAMAERLDADIMDTAVDTDDYISCSTQEAILIPSASHLITVLDKSDFEESKRTGIGSFRIGEELLVTGKYDEETQEPVYTPAGEPDDEELFSLIITHNITRSNG